MLRNILAATLRNLARNGFYSAISIFGLSVGLAAALIAALVVKNQLTYDRFIPGHERLYLMIFIYQQLAPSPGASAAQTRQTEAIPAGTASAEASGISIAVLPFVNLSSDAEQEFFSDGMTEEITSALGAEPGPEPEEAHLTRRGRLKASRTEPG